MEQRFKSRKFIGIDFTPRKKYRTEIERLERINGALQRSFAVGEKDRCDLLKKCAEERNLRYAAETKLHKFQRKRGMNGRFTKDK